ncbi:MAG: hypothetical protein C0604_05700, partial [Clostridiales bacterium]
MKRKLCLILCILMVAMSITPVMAAEESLTDVVAELGVSNLLKLQGVFNGYFTDSKLDALNTYLGTEHSDLRTYLNSDGMDVEVLKNLADDIAGVGLEGITESSEAASAIFGQKDAVIATLGGIVDRIVAARGESTTNTEYAYDIVVNHLLNKSSVVTYNTSTGVYSLDFAAYKADSALKAEMELIMPDTFSEANYTASIDSLELYFEYILNSDDFDDQVTNFNAAIDSWNESAFYNAYTPTSGGGGGGTTAPVEETPVVTDPVTEESATGETTVTTTVETAATVTESETGVQEAVVDDSAVEEAVEAIVEQVAAIETEEGETVAPT